MSRKNKKPGDKIRWCQRVLHSAAGMTKKDVEIVVEGEVKDVLEDGFYRVQRTETFLVSPEKVRG